MMDQLMKQFIELHIGKTALYNFVTEKWCDIHRAEYWNKTKTNKIKQTILNSQYQIFRIADYLKYL